MEKRFVMLEEDEELKGDKKKDKEEDDNKDTKKKKDKDDDDYTSGVDILDDLDDDKSSSSTDSPDDSDSDPSNDDVTSGIYEALANLVYMYTVASYNFQHIHFHATGKNFDNIHNTSDEYYRHFRYRIDNFSEIALQGNIKLDNLANAKDHTDIEIDTADSYTYETASRLMDDTLKHAIEQVKNVRSMSDNRTDIQSTLDDELKWLNEQSLYFMRRRMMPIGESFYNFEVK